MAVINLTSLRCTPVELLYNYVLNKSYGMACNDKYTEATAYEAYKDYWMYQKTVDCDPNCNIERIIRKSNYGCSTFDICSTRSINCNITVSVDNGATPFCRSINITVS